MTTGRLVYGIILIVAGLVIVGLGAATLLTTVGKSTLIAASGFALMGLVIALVGAFSLRAPSKM